MKTFLAATAATVLAATCYGQGTMYLLNSNRNIYTVDIATGATTLAGTVSAGGTVAGLAYDCATGTMYMTSTSEDMLYRLDLTTFVATPVGSYGDSTIVMHGLEWDHDSGQLFGGSGGSLYTIDPVSGAATVLGNAGTTSFLNLGYHSGRGLLYGLTSADDSLYIVDRATGAGTLVGPLNGPTNPHGVAYVPHNDTLYVACSNTQTLSTINVDTGTATVVGFLGSGNWLGLAWVPTTCPTPPAVDARVSLSGPAQCSVGAGGTGTWVATVVNSGTNPVTNATVTFTMPSGSSFVSSTPTATPSGSTVTVNLGSLAPAASATLSVTVTLPSQGVATGSATVTISETDERALNNTSSRGTLVSAPQPTSAAARGLVSNVTGAANREVPGIPGTLFSTTVFERPQRSPNGQLWIMAADTDFATTSADEVLLIGNANNEITVGVREGDTAPDFSAFGAFDDVLGITDAGHFVFSTNTTGPTTADEAVVKWNGTAFEFSMIEGQAVPNTAFVFGSTSSNATIQNDGTVSFLSNFTGATTTTDTALFSRTAASMLAQEGTTVPTGQIAGASFTVKAFETGATDGQGFFPSADGQHYLWTGTVNDATTQDRVIVVDNAVVLQEAAGVPNTSLESPILAIHYAFMEANGDWFAYGSNADTMDWVVRNGALLTNKGAPIFPGAGENWHDAVTANCFVLASGSPNGNYVVGGFTDSANTLTDSVVVLNGTTVVARENDPVDLNNNGVFDDNVYIRAFVAAGGFVTDTDLYLIVQVRDGATAVGCATANTDLGDVFVRIPLPGGGCPGDECGPQDYNGDGDAGTDQDIEAFFACLGGNCCDTCFCQGSDFNGDGDFGTDQDIEAFFRVLGGNPC
ncbi:MAG TPA: hypothetical protein VD997_12100 [Phycisphaerales bacterium]|nr:hypothetical protein [Phycisphaerales bacterium]